MIRENKFLGQAFKKYIYIYNQKIYGLKAKFEPTANPEANWALERFNHVIANLIHMYDLQNNNLDEDKSWSEILAAMDFAGRSMYHTTLQDMPEKFLFGSDMILNTLFIADWDYIIIRHQKQ